MVDQNFAGTVVLMLSHDESGAHGLVINRPMDLTVAEVAENLSMPIGAHGDLTVLWGGPVDTSTGFVLIADPTADGEEFREVVQGIGVGLSRDALQIAMDRPDGDFLLCLGYAGWAPSQLEDEMQAGAWIEVDLDARLLWDSPLETRWNDAISLLGIENPAYLSTKPIDE
jgi:putative transcriptional regulator